jgi:pimeloyl-ACP methyl ester carboxylesterase
MGVPAVKERKKRNGNVKQSELKPTRNKRPRAGGLLALAAAYSHPTRVRILAAMNSPKRRSSPHRLADETGEDVKRVAYYFRELADLGFLELVDVDPVRGSVEHFYEPKTTALAWAREWSQMPPVFKQHMLALTERLAVEALGAAIDAGTFEAREDTVLAQDRMRLDQESANKAWALMAHTVEELMKLGDSAGGRLRETGVEGVLISYMAASYGGALRAE